MQSAHDDPANWTDIISNVFLSASEEVSALQNSIITELCYMPHRLLVAKQLKSAVKNRERKDTTKGKIESERELNVRK